MNRGTDLIIETFGDLHTVRAVETGADGVEHDLSVTSDSGTHRTLRLEDIGTEHVFPERKS